MNLKVPILLTVAVVVLSCETPVTSRSSLNATWKYAAISIPDTMTSDGSICEGTLASKKTRACLDGIKPAAQYPLVLFMHGCAGLGSDYFGGGSRSAIRMLRSIGYAVVAPDSFAREGRKSECNPSGRKHRTLSLRFEEIDYALAQIPEFDWVDPTRMVLAGQSEGGNTVAEYQGDDVFVGYIILSWDCRHGLFPPGPVLAIQGGSDPIMKTTCSVGFRENSDSIVVPGAGHNVSVQSETKQAIERFLGIVAPL